MFTICKLKAIAALEKSVGLVDSTVITQGKEFFNSVETMLDELVSLFP